MMLRILIIAPSLLMCDTITKAINGNKEVEVIQQMTNVDDAITVLDDCDVLLVSNTLPLPATLAFIRQTRRSHPQIKTILMGANKTESSLLDYIEAGVAGYILEEDSVEMLVKKIKAAYNDTPIISPEITASLMVRVAELAHLNRNGVNGMTRSRLKKLTNRETEILNLLGQDFSNRQISEHLFIEIGTVKNHVHNILKKLKVRSRHDAAAYVQTLDVLENPSSALNGAERNGYDRQNGAGKLS